MALNFPDSPTLNQVYTDSVSGFSYQWNGTVWISFTPSTSSQILIIDDISGSFNGVTQTFALTSNGNALTPATVQSLIINLGGVIQDPSSDYSISGSNITFSTPPTNGLTFSGVSLGPSVPINTISDGSVTPSKLSLGGPSWNTGGNLSVSGFVTATSYYGSGANLTGVGIGSTGSINTTGIITASSFFGDGTGLTGVGVGSQTSVNTAGIVTSTLIDAFIPTGQKVISVNTTLNNNQENISFAEDLVIGAGTTFTVSTGTTVRMDAFNVIDATSITSTSIAGTTITGTTITGTTVIASSDLDIPNGNTTQRPAVPTLGSFRYNNSVNILEIYDGTNWRGIILTDPLVPVPEGTGVFGGGSISSNVIDYITIATTGNATDFGDLTLSREGISACSSSTRGVFGGGATPTVSNVIDYITIASMGNATDFGDLTVARSGPAACSSSTRGVFGGGYVAPTLQNVIDFITITTTGNATDFGDLTISRRLLSSCSSSTRGIFGGGAAPTANNTIDFITISTTGNATDFGDLTVARNSLAACSSSTRGVFGGGFLAPLNSNVIDYITIASAGNAIDFGDLTLARSTAAACSSSTRGVFGSGSDNTIDYITLATTGNATDFGDLTVVRNAAACSSCHGGLS